MTDASESHQMMMENGLNRLMRTVGGNARAGSATSTERSSFDTALYVATAVLMLIGGYIHIKLYFDGYRDVPNANLGRSFLANAAGSLVVALALVALRSRLAALAALGLANATLVAFWISRTDRGIFSFNEHGFQPSPEATIALVCEIAAALLALMLLAGPELKSARAD
jgi:hypothetical protein